MRGQETENKYNGYRECTRVGQEVNRDAEIEKIRQTIMGQEK